MRKILLYTATSLDGFIAREDESLDWLDNFPYIEGEDYGYQHMYASIDTTLMGNGTYRLVQSFDVPFPYPDKTNYVFTKDSTLTKDEYVHFVSGDIINFVKELKSKEGKHIWLVGGGQINAIFLEQGLIDEIHLSVIPIYLGKGIHLFHGVGSGNLILKEQKTYDNGVMKLLYKTKNA